MIKSLREQLIEKGVIKPAPIQQQAGAVTPTHTKPRDELVKRIIIRPVTGKH